MCLIHLLGILFHTASDSCATDRVDTDVPLSSIQEFLEYMFSALDEDGSGDIRKSVSQVRRPLLTLSVLSPGSLSDAEVRAGIQEFGIQLTEEDLDLLSLYMQEHGVNGELTLSMFMDLVRASEMELPAPGEKPFRYARRCGYQFPLTTYIPVPDPLAHAHICCASKFGGVMSFVHLLLHRRRFDITHDITLSGNSRRYVLPRFLCARCAHACPTAQRYV